MAADTFAAPYNAWQVELDADNAAVQAAVAHDPAWNAFFLSDLEPPFRQYTRIALARHGDATPAAALLDLRHPAFNATITSGDPDGVAAIMATADLPAMTSLYARREHLPAVATRYAIAAGRWMLLMALAPEAFVASARGVTVERLGVADAAALLDLYTGYPESAFAPEALVDGVFYGVRRGGRIVAAGGTHAVTARYGVATVGSIFTREEARGQGLASAVTSAVVAELLAIGMTHIGLNVAAANAPALTVYRRLGFHTHCEFWQAAARLL